MSGTVMKKTITNLHTVITRLRTAALFKFLVFRMRRLFGEGGYLRAALFKKS